MGRELGDPNGVLVLDPSAFPQKRRRLRRVQRQRCGRLGKLENCQVGVYLAYVSSREHALVDFRLYLPKGMGQGQAAAAAGRRTCRCVFRTRHELALQMLDEHGPLLPHGWVAGDDEMGRSSWFREHAARGECYLLAVPSNTLVRDLLAADPLYAGRGPRPRTPFRRVDRWCVPAACRRRRGRRSRSRRPRSPVEVQAVWTLVQARTEGRPSAVAEVLVVFRERQGDGTWKHDYLLSSTSLTTPLAGYTRVFKAEHRVEECLQRAGEAGLADYEVRTWQLASPSGSGTRGDVVPDDGNASGKKNGRRR